jgi:ferredoxin-thioredoxin reductase catalytic subunit
MDTYQTNLTRLTACAAGRGLRLNPDQARVEKVVGLMAKNFDAVGEWVCPCKQKSKPPVSGADITCPCPTLDAEIAASGMCHCRLFFAAS